MVDRIPFVSKAAVARLFIGANLAIVVGLVVGLTTALAALAGGVIAIGGPSIVTVDSAAVAGSLPWFLMAVVVVAGGAIASVASWIGALLNTVRLDDKIWFVGLLVLGLVSFGWVAMVAYVIAGPDSATQGVADLGISTASQT